jgi:signal transduction histidine kinase
VRKARVCLINIFFITAIAPVLFSRRFGYGSGISYRTYDLFVFLCIDFVCSVLIDFSDKKSSASFLFFVKIVFINIMALPFIAQTPYFFSLLLCMFFWELNIYFSFPINIVYTLLSVSMSIYILFFFYVNAHIFYNIQNVDTYIAFIFVIFTLVCSILIKYLSAKMVENQGIIRSQHSAIVDLTKANLNFLNYASLIKQQTLTHERQKLTGELHDIVGHPLTNIISMMDAVIRNPLGNPCEQENLNRWIRDQAQGCLKNTRVTLYNLRNLDKDELKGVDGLNNLFKTFSFATKVKVNCEWGNLIWNLPYEIEQVIYKTTEEALINAFKHGRAKEINVMFWHTGTAITIVIRDDGIGSQTYKTGIGQETMKERIEDLGGNISFSNYEYGYVVSINIPYKNRTI